MYAKDLEKPKYKFLIKGRENAEIKHLGDKSGFTEWLNSMDDIYDDIKDYNKLEREKS